MKPFLFIGRIGILTSLALIRWSPARSIQAADRVPERAFPNSWERSPLWPRRTDHRGCSGSGHLGGRHREHRALPAQLSHVRFYPRT
jgi:hypothetical protein